LTKSVFRGKHPQCGCLGRKVTASGRGLPDEWVRDLSRFWLLSLDSLVSEANIRNADVWGGFDRESNRAGRGAPRGCVNRCFRPRGRYVCSGVSAPPRRWRRLWGGRRSRRRNAPRSEQVRQKNKRPMPICCWANPPFSILSAIHHRNLVIDGGWHVRNSDNLIPISIFVFPSGAYLRKFVLVVHCV
jgi:hypothetical protein